MFKTKKEKYAYVKGLKKGTRACKSYGTKSKSAKKNKLSQKCNKKTSVHKGIRSSVFSGDDFLYDSNGRIKGSYTPDGFFEPD